MNFTSFLMKRLFADRSLAFGSRTADKQLLRADWAMRVPKGFAEAPKTRGVKPCNGTRTQTTSARKALSGCPTVIPSKFRQPAQQEV